MKTTNSIKDIFFSRSFAAYNELDKLKQNAKVKSCWSISIPKSRQNSRTFSIEIILLKGPANN